MTDLNELGVLELLSVFRSGDGSPAEALDACFRRIGEVDHHLRAVLTLCEDYAVPRAELATKRWQDGNAAGSEGVPFGVKDIIDTAGIRTTGGSVIYREYVPTESATVVARLEDAGAVLVGKLQTMEFAMGDNAHYGPTLNPWDFTRATGGSSSGSAVAVAARELPLAIGTDSGGSIRVPACFCGVTGFKPTFGRVSRHGVMPLSWSLDHVGPMARSAADIAAVLDVIAGHDMKDPYSLPAGVHARAAGLEESVDIRGLRIGVPRGWLFEVLSPEVEEVVVRAAMVLESLGAEIVQVALPHAYLADTMNWVILLAEMASLHSHTFGRLRDYGEPLTRQLLVDSQWIELSDYLRALRLIPLLQQDLEEAFVAADALLVPGMPTAAPLSYAAGFTVSGETYRWEELVSRTVSLFNVTGVPAVALPGGMSDDGMPLGVQVVCSPLRDALCLRIGEAFQRATSHHKTTPLI